MGPCHPSVPEATVKSGPFLLSFLFDPRSLPALDGVDLASHACDGRGTNPFPLQNSSRAGCGFLSITPLALLFETTRSVCNLLLK